MIILIAEDNEDHFILTRDALHEAGLSDNIRWVADGEALMDYLLQAPAPQLILLDLNMPRMDGRQALKEIRAHPRLRQIPIVVLTTSKAPNDVLRSYELGANSFIKKPLTYDEMVHCMKTLKRYWLEIVELPKTDGF